jgi:CheY-like chemotaxis protein
MDSPPINVLLADDDSDDCLLFKEALEELPLTTNLVIVHDGVELMQYLTLKQDTLPDILFLDLNMPRKNGFECLSEIKQHKKLKALRVIIFSTSFNPVIADQLQKQGAQHYIRKPAEFSNLRKLILQSLTLLKDKNAQMEAKNFILSV